MNSIETLLKVERADLSFSSRGGTFVQALRQVSFNLGYGKSLAIVGESGSGKTTLLRAVLGLLPLDSGEIYLLGENLGQCPTSTLVSLRRRCGFIPQDPYGCLPPTMDVLDAVTEPFILVNGKNRKGEAIEKASQLLKELGLGEGRISKARIRSGLSGGQRQRVSVARALILRPTLLLADEPTSMQDASTRGEIIEILNRRVATGMSLIFVTHDLLLARAAAGRTMVLYGGMVCEYGNSSKILADPVHPYTKALYSALPKLGEKLKLLAKDRTIQTEERGCPFRSRCPLSDDQCLSFPPIKEEKGRMVGCWKV